MDADRNKATEIVPLTGLRGLASLIVMLYHFGQPYHTLGVATGFRIPFGYLAVDVFFVLSGFVITYANGYKFQRSCYSVRCYIYFLNMRVGRLVPAYLMAMILFIVKMSVDFGGEHPFKVFRWHDIIGNFLMLTGWGLGIVPIVVDSWSVSAEWLCYIMFPALLFLVTGRASWCLVTAGLCVAGVGLVVHSGEGVKGPMDVVMQTSAYPLLRCLCGFTLGVVSYRLWRIEFVARLLHKNCVFAGLVALVCLATSISKKDLVIYMCLPIVITACASGSTCATNLLGGRLLQFLGRISYSLYLLHDIFVTISVRLAFYLHFSVDLCDCYSIIAGYGVAFAIFLAWVSYRWIELPGQRLLTNWAILSSVG